MSNQARNTIIAMLINKTLPDFSNAITLAITSGELKDNYLGRRTVRNALIIDRICNDLLQGYLGSLTGAMADAIREAWQLVSCIYQEEASQLLHDLGCRYVFQSEWNVDDGTMANEEIWLDTWTGQQEIFQDGQKVAIYA